MNKKQRKSAQKAARKAAKKHPVIITVVAVILIIAAVAVALAYYFKWGPFKQKNTPEISSGNVAEITSADLSVHFPELGNANAGDCVLIDCGDTEVLIDGGSKYNSAPTLINYISNYCTDGVLEIVVITHAHEDHIAALAGRDKDGILYNFSVGTVIKYGQSISESGVVERLDNCLEKLEEDGTDVFTAGECYREERGAKRRYTLNESGTISLNVLYSKFYDQKSNNENNHSVATLLTQETAGGTLQYLFTGDMEKVAEDALVDYYAVQSNHKSVYDVLPSEVVLYKAGHHGSPTSSGEKLMAAINPENVVVCCCAGAPEYTTEPLNVFPGQEAIDRIAPYTANIYVTTLGTNLPAKNAEGKFTSKSGFSHTSMNGDIVFYYKESLKLYCSNNTVKLKDTDWFKENRVWKGAA